MHVRVQRQIAAFERTWHRANTELRRVRTEKAEPSAEGSLDKYLDFLCAPPAPGELASLRQRDRPPACPSAQTQTENDVRTDGAPA